MRFSITRLARLCALLPLILAACAFPKLPDLPGLPGQAAEGTPTPLSSTPSATAISTTAPQAPDAAAFGPTDAASLHGVILFSSAAANPFADAKKDFGSTETATTDPSSFSISADQSLWAISLDGTRAGRISREGFGSALSIPQKASDKVRFIQNGVQLTGDGLQAIIPPSECDRPTDQPIDPTNPPCGSFQFSSGAHEMAYLSGAETQCGRTLTLMDQDTSTTVKSWPQVIWYSFLQNGSLLLTQGDCDQQRAFWYIPGTDQQSPIERTGTAYWNPSHTAVIFENPGKDAVQRQLWGINLVTSRIFLWPAGDLISEDTPIWLADGHHFVYQHRAYQYDAAQDMFTLTGPLQVVLMDAFTRSQQQMAYRSDSDYHLCATAGTPCPQPYGDWVQVLRTPFQAKHFPLAEREEKSAARCAFYGLDCDPSAETLAINWKTLAQSAWEDANLPAPDAPADSNAAMAPDISGVTLYQDGNGAFALYPGADGKSLWYVPQGGEPMLWVQDGSGFVALP